MDLLNAFEDHWRAFQTSSELPFLHDLLDNQVPAIAPWTLISEFDGDTQPIRLCGTGITELLGKEITGLDYLDLFAGPVRQSILDRDSICVSYPCGVRTVVSVLTDFQAVRTIDGLNLPAQRRTGERVLFRIADARAFAEIRRTADSVNFTIQNQETSAWVDVGHGVPDIDPMDAAALHKEAERLRPDLTSETAEP